MKKIKLLKSLMVCSCIATPLLTVTSCNKDTNFAEQLVEESINEFKELCIHPRPSGSMDEIRSYLANWSMSHGFMPLFDNYGNMWFDVPATAGCEAYPKVILQGHMDMVFSYDQMQSKTKGIPDPKTYSPIPADEVVDGERIIHGKDYFTNLGVDDGYGMSLALAIAANKQISHGPLRCLFTVDEEIGLFGAINLSQAALDSDYLISLDGEGQKENPYMIFSGCQGLKEYVMKNRFTELVTPGSSENCIRIDVSGLKGQHFFADTYYDKDKGALIYANADAMILDIITALKQDGSTLKLATFEHKNKNNEDVEFEPRNLPQFAQAVIYTNKDDTQVKEKINELIKTWKNSYKLEDWNQVTVDANLVEDPKKPSIALSEDDTQDLLNLFHNEGVMKFSVGMWEGETDDEKASKNYPQLVCNISTFTLKNSGDGNLDFSVGIREGSSLYTELHDLSEKSKSKWIEKYGSEGLIVNFETEPWDITNSHAFVDFSKEAYEHFGITPCVEKTRGGLETAYFCHSRPTLNVTVLGPRVEEIHTYKEKLYANTILPLCKVMLYMLENMNTLM